MLLRIVSDLHSEWFTYNKFEKLLKSYLPIDDRDSDSTLIMAGDIGSFEKYSTTFKPLLEIVSKRFKHVIMVYGNHEFYSGTWWDKYKTFWSDKSLPSNVTVLDKDYLIIGDIAFIGATLWTSMNNRDPVTMFMCERGMNDYNLIKYPVVPDGPYSMANVRISAESTVARHESDIAFIKSALHALRNTVPKKIVITHHLPSFKSVNPIYYGDTLNYAFASDLDEIISLYQPDLWVHGHTHSSCSYDIEGTHVICNALGYHGTNETSGKTNYNKKLFIEV